MTGKSALVKSLRAGGGGCGCCGGGKSLTSELRMLAAPSSSNSSISTSSAAAASSSRGATCAGSAAPRVGNATRFDASSRCFATCRINASCDVKIVRVSGQGRSLGWNDPLVQPRISSAAGSPTLSVVIA